MQIDGPWLQNQGFKLMACLALVLAISPSTAEVRLPSHLSHEENPEALHHANDIFHKCLTKAKRIADERVCEAEKPAIQICMRTEMKEKNAKTAQATCEHLFIM